MSDLPTFGPFKVEKFLLPPSKVHSQQNILQLEEFAFSLDSRPQPMQVGLDILDEDDPVSQSILKGTKITWKGYVVFSNEANNRKHISREGFDDLARQIDQGKPNPNWEIGFKVLLEGKYWRHKYERDKSIPNAFLHRIMIDLDSVFVANNSSRKEEQANRRFCIMSMDEEFKRKSRMMIRYNLVLIMEHINLEIGQTFQSPAKTVDWYRRRYLELFPAKREDVGTFDGLFIPATEFKNELSRHIGSNTLQKELRTKRLVSSKNINEFINAIRSQPRRTAQSPRSGDVREFGNNPGELQGLVQMDETISDIQELPLTDEEDCGNGNEFDELMDDSSLFTESFGQNSREVSNTPREGSLNQIRGGSTSTLPSPVTNTRTTASTPLVDAESKQLLKKVPKEILQRPAMPADCRWQCSVEGCSYVVDFKGGLPLTALRLLSETDKAFLKRKSWVANSSQANLILLKVTAPHYKAHLKDLGLEIVGKQIRRLSG